MARREEIDETQSTFGGSKKLRVTDIPLTMFYQITAVTFSLL
jgi:hypothetical protein